MEGVQRTTLQNIQKNMESHHMLGGLHYQELMFEEEIQETQSLSVRSIQHYDCVFEEFSCHLLAHEEFLRKKKA